MTAIVVKVSDQISALDLSIVCPNVTVTKKTVSCVLTSVRGTDLTGQFTYNTTNGSHLISSIPGKSSVKIVKRNSVCWTWIFFRCTICYLRFAIGDVLSHSGCLGLVTKRQWCGYSTSKYSDNGWSNRFDSVIRVGTRFHDDLRKWKTRLRSFRDTDTRHDHSSCFVVSVPLQRSIVTVRTCVELAALRIRYNVHQVSTQLSVVPVWMLQQRSECSNRSMQAHRFKSSLNGHMRQRVLDTYK